MAAAADIHSDGPPLLVDAHLELGRRAGQFTLGVEIAFPVSVILSVLPDADSLRPYWGQVAQQSREVPPHWHLTVSYTHLTLPTKRIV